MQRSGKYAVELHAPAEGVYAGEEVGLRVRVTDASGVARAKIDGSVSLPSMPGMPKITPAIHAAGVPGDYGLETAFPQRGDYRIELAITPPGEDRPFRVVFPLEVREAAPGRTPAPTPFALEVGADPARPLAGRPAVLTLVVRSRESGKPVTEFDDLDDEERLHLILVREDLGALFYELPEPGPDGRFTLRFPFPSGGDWRLFAEAAPKGAGAQEMAATLAVDGPRGMRAMLVPALRPMIQQNGITLGMSPMNLVARKTLPLLFTLTDTSGRPLTDLQLWRGATAHLLFIERDARTLVRAHPDEADWRSGRNGNLAFLVRFPKAGIYRGWVQIRRGGITHTLPFVVRVAENR